MRFLSRQGHAGAPLKRTATYRFPTPQKGDGEMRQMTRQDRTIQDGIGQDRKVHGCTSVKLPTQIRIPKPENFRPDPQRRRGGSCPEEATWGPLKRTA